MEELLGNDITGLGLIAMVIGGTFAVVKMALGLATTTLKARFGGEELEEEHSDTYNNRDQILLELHESMNDIHPLIMEPVPNRPGERMIWRETNGKLREEIRRLSTSIDALTEIIKDVRGAARESANESREARAASEKVMAHLLAG